MAIQILKADGRRQSIGMDLKQFSKKDLEHAGDDARLLMTEDAEVRGLIAGMICIRRLYLLWRFALDKAMAQWEVTHPQLVAQTLVMSAQDKAIENHTIEDLTGMTDETILRVLREHFLPMEREYAQSRVPGDHNPAEGESQPVPAGTEGDKVEQAGVSGEGDCREESGASEFRSEDAICSNPKRGRRPKR